MGIFATIGLGLAGSFAGGILSWLLIGHAGGIIVSFLLTMAILLATAGHWGLTRAAKHDPQLSRVYVRHIRYQDYYPARADVHAPPGYVFPSVPD